MIKPRGRPRKIKIEPKLTPAQKRLLAKKEELNQTNLRKTTKRLIDLERRSHKYEKNKLTLKQAIKEEIKWFKENEPNFLYDMNTGKRKTKERLFDQLSTLLAAFNPYFSKFSEIKH